MKKIVSNNLTTFKINDELSVTKVKEYDSLNIHNIVQCVYVKTDELSDSIEALQEIQKTGENLNYRKIYSYQLGIAFVIIVPIIYIILVLIFSNR